MEIYGVVDDEPIKEGESLGLNVSYPFDPNYEYHTR